MLVFSTLLAFFHNCLLKKHCPALSWFYICKQVGLGSAAPWVLRLSAFNATGSGFKWNLVCCTDLRGHSHCWSQTYNPRNSIHFFGPKDLKLHPAGGGRSERCDGEKNMFIFIFLAWQICFWSCDIITPCCLLRLSHGCHDSCQCCDRFLLAVHIPFSFPFSHSFPFMLFSFFSDLYSFTFIPCYSFHPFCPSFSYNLIFVVILFLCAYSCYTM